LDAGCREVAHLNGTCNSSSQNFKKEQKLVIEMRRPKKTRKMTIVIKDGDIKVRRLYAPAVHCVQSKRLYSRKNIRTDE
jgi:hypothetical protein